MTPPSTQGKTDTPTNSSKWGAISGFVSFVGKLAVTITGVAAALFLVIPTLEPREKLGATVEAIAVTQGVHYETYDRNASGAGDAPTSEGMEVLVSANLQAFKDRSYAMNISLLDAKDHTLLMVGLHEPFASTCENKSPRANEDVVTWRCWTAAPPEGTEYYVRATLEDAGRTSEITEGPIIGRREVLGFIESDVFAAVQQPDDG